MKQSADANKVTAEQLRKKLFCYLAAALLALMLGIAMTLSVTLIDSLKKAEAHSLFHIAEVQSLAISEWCRSVKNIARQITSRTRIRQELVKFNYGKITLQELNRFTQPKLSDAMNLSEEVVGILRLDRKNQIVARCGYGASLPLGRRDLSAYISESVTISEPLVIKNTPTIIVSAPIQDRSGVRQGTDLVIVELEVLRNITDNAKDLGKTSDILLGYEQDHAVWPLFPQPADSGSSSAPSDVFHMVQGDIGKAVLGKSGLSQIGDMTVVYYPIAASGWGLAITQNTQELYSTLNRKIALIGGVAILIYTLVLFGFWFIMRPMAGRILLHTDELEKKIKEKTETLETEIVERKKIEQEKEKSIVALQEAMLEIKTLSGMLPICANCKKIRDDEGYWNQIESFISKHSEAEFSHGICPECAKKLYPDFCILNE
jgi:sensor domain CHASE-containing protein